MEEMKNIRNAYKETIEIIEIMGEKYKAKISKEFLEFLNREQNIKYKSKIKKELTFKEQKLLYETKVLLSYIYNKFWKE